MLVFIGWKMPGCSDDGLVAHSPYIRKCLLNSLTVLEAFLNSSFLLSELCFKRIQFCLCVPKRYS